METARKEMMKPEDFAPVDVDGVEVVELVVRNVNGEGVLFTSDGKMIGHQVAACGHYYYVGQPPNRKRMFRATFLVDNMKSDLPR